MNAQKAVSQNPRVEGKLSKALIISVLLHVSVVVVGTFGLPYLARKTEPVEIAITVEMVELSDISQTDRLAPPQEEKDEKEPPKPTEKKPVYNKAAPEEVAPEPDLLTPKPPEAEEIPDLPKPEDEKKEEPEPKPKIEKPPKPKPRPKNVPKPKPPEQEKPKEEEKKEEQDINSLLNTVLNENEQPSTPQETPETPTENSSQVTQIAPVTGQLSRSEMDSLNALLQQCWVLNAGGKDAETLKVTVDIALAPDMSVQNVQILDQFRYNSDTAFQAAAEAVRRALLHPTCKKLPLPAEKYQQFKMIRLTFDPSQML